MPSLASRDDVLGVVQISEPPTGYDVLLTAFLTGPNEITSGGFQGVFFADSLLGTTTVIDTPPPNVFSGDAILGAVRISDVAL